MQRPFFIGPYCVYCQILSILIHKQKFGLSRKMTNDLEMTNFMKKFDLRLVVWFKQLQISPHSTVTWCEWAKDQHLMMIWDLENEVRNAENIYVSM